MIDVVEQIARMNQTQRDEFVHDFVTKWPQLAYDIKEAIPNRNIPTTTRKRKTRTRSIPKNMHSMMMSPFLLKTWRSNEN